MSAVPETREQIIAILGAWRREHNVKPLAVQELIESLARVEGYGTFGTTMRKLVREHAIAVMR